MEGWYTPFKPMDPKNQMQHPGGPGGGPPAAKKAKGRPHHGLGYKKNEIQWTPDGWVQKDTSHKVTSMMKPLPELDMIPPFSTTHPDAANDRDKLKMLKNNVNMMTIGMCMYTYFLQSKNENFYRSLRIFRENHHRNFCNQIARVWNFTIFSFILSL